MVKIQAFTSGLALAILCSGGLIYGNIHQSYIVSEEDVAFHLFVRGNHPNGVRLIAGDRDILFTSGFNRSLPTVACIHGYFDDANTWISHTRQELLKAEDVNFISVNWWPCSINLIVSRVSVCMRQAARYLGELLKFLRREGNLDFDRTHLIGHSLGAHLAAFAAKTISDEPTIGRITGLDPAGPGFENAHESDRLNPRSAKFVDVIHTCIVFVGIARPIGTIDFYPNGGFFQPGCKSIDLFCNHLSAIWYFQNTINGSRREKYPAKKCKALESVKNKTCDGEIAFMGYRAPGGSPGLYYVEVTSNSWT